MTHSIFDEVTRIAREIKSANLTLTKVVQHKEAAAARSVEEQNSPVTVVGMIQGAQRDEKGQEHLLYKISPQQAAQNLEQAKRAHSTISNLNTQFQEAVNKLDAVLENTNSPAPAA
ncbi:MAG: hypothetical protein Tsb005_05640 [Gammaproteobacteria bacterium]